MFLLNVMTLNYRRPIPGQSSQSRIFYLRWNKHPATLVIGSQVANISTAFGYMFLHESPPTVSPKHNPLVTLQHYTQRRSRQGLGRFRPTETHATTQGQQRTPSDVHNDTINTPSPSQSKPNWSTLPPPSGKQA